MSFLPTDPDPELLSELAVLAAILEHNDLLDESGLTSSDFGTILAEDTFKLMEQLRLQHHPITPVSLADLEPRHAAMFWEITTAVHAGEVRAFDFHVNRVRTMGLRRRMTTAAARIQHMTTQTEIPSEDLTDTARRLIDEAIGAGVGLDESVSMGSVALDVLMDMGQTTEAYPTAWPQLTGALRGMRPGQLIVLAARPSVGKSAIALQIASAVERVASVGFISMEMGRREITQRMLAQSTLVPFSNIERGELVGHMESRLHEFVAAYQDRARMLVDDRSGQTINTVRSQIRSWLREHPDLKLVVIDYLQLLTGPSGVSRQEVVSAFSRELKIMAGEFGITILALSQLNRNPEARADKRPAMSDLRESGAIEQDADVVLLLHRDYAEDGAVGPELEIIIAKNRQGPQTSVWLQWHGEFMIAIEE